MRAAGREEGCPPNLDENKSTRKEKSPRGSGTRELAQKGAKLTIIQPKLCAGEGTVRKEMINSVCGELTNADLGRQKTKIYETHTTQPEYTEGCILSEG